MQTSHRAEQEVYFLIIGEAGGDITDASIQDLWIEDAHRTGEGSGAYRMILWGPLYYRGLWHTCGDSELAGFLDSRCPSESLDSSRSLLGNL